MVVEYYYDAYGNIINITDSSGINLSNINPFRYRSYYHDNETGWYYLNSGFYDPIIKRFITPDDIDYLGVSGSALSYNLYSYCENNPVTNINETGDIPVHIIAGVIPRIVDDVIRGKSVFTVTKVEAYALAIAAGGTPKSVICEIDKGKEDIKGYYWHYHVSRSNKAHIWYLF